MRNFISSYLIKAFENNIYVHSLSNGISLVLPAKKETFFLTSYCYAGPIIEYQECHICR